MTRGPARQVYPTTSPQPSQDAGNQDTLLLGHRQWLVKYTLLPEWRSQLIKQVLHAPTPGDLQVGPAKCTHAVHPTT